MVTNRDEKDYSEDLPETNPDPITGEPGAHPIGTGVGATGFGVVGTAVGTLVGGPVGGVVGAVVGSAFGGLVGKGIAETFEPTIEQEYWRHNYRSRPYVEPDYDYDRDYAVAYRTGYEGYPNYAQQGMAYTHAEPYLRADYEKRRGTSRLEWDKARYATEDAWNRLEHLYQGRREHEDYWRTNYRSRPYVETGYDYDYYAPAYQQGYDSYSVYGLDRGMTYEDAESYIRSDYERHYGNSGLGWEKAKYAIQDAWNRMKETASNGTHRTRRFDKS